MRLASLALFACLASACFLRPARAPMSTIRYPAPSGHAQAVMVLLPGFGDRAATFAERGFVAALQTALPGLEVVAADAHFGYYRKRSLLLRLEQDVLAPLRARGVRDIYLAGTSMGGHGAVALARTQPDGVRGVLLFAPYLGPRAVVSEVAAAGGLCAYTPRQPITDDSAGFARANYVWLRDNACKPSAVSLYTAVGRDDSLAPAVAEIARALPAEHTLLLPGGHGWKVWTPAAAELASRLTLSQAGH